MSKERENKGKDWWEGHGRLKSTILAFVRVYTHHAIWTFELFIDNDLCFDIVIVLCNQKNK